MVRSIFQSNSAWTALRILLCCLSFTPPFFVKASGSQCFFNNGALADTNFPCNPTETESFCCGSGWACLPNRLCAFPATNGNEIMLARGACTAKSWATTSQCPNFCLDIPNSQGIQVTKCADPDIYCCLSDKTCNCATGLGTISLPGGLLPFTTVQSGTLVSQGTAVAKETMRMTERTTVITTESMTEKVTETVVSSPTASIAETSSTSTEPEPSSSTATNAPSITTDPISSSNSSSSSSTSTNKASSSPESKEGIKIGVAVGVCLGVLIIAFICIFGFWREKRLKKSMEDLKSRWIPVEIYMNQGGHHRDGGLS